MTYFHARKEGRDWRGEVIAESGQCLRKTSNVYPTQESAERAARIMWDQYKARQQMGEVA